ncbi:MAG: enoyl-CoA hydratase/isomerase family protein [Phycisphaerae bacterium]|nr:enoyl-CoA hydratase/isomerase family protein [Phycisphaerae bacterium]
MIEYSVTDKLCILRLNAPPFNVLTSELFEALTAAVGRANADQDTAAILIMGNETHFSAGADVNIFRTLTTPEGAAEISRIFQGALAVVEQSSKPVLAALAGAVMGCALELAAACRLRVCTPGTTFTMPEVKLGLNPGAGGTQRLPRLIDAEAALRMLLTAESIDSQQALELGLVDAITDNNDLITAARQLLAARPDPPRTCDRTDRISEATANRAAFDWAEQVIAATRPEDVAPRKILHAVRTGIEQSFEAGLKAEQDVVIDCMNSPATRNRIYLFFATRKTAKVDDVGDARPSEVKTAAVVGMGSMGAGIAHALLMAGVPVTVVDKDPTMLEKGKGHIAKSLEKRVAGGKMTTARAEHMLAMLSTSTELGDIAAADIVIEAVFEDAALKQSVFAAIEDVCSPHTIIASNTSTLSLDLLAEKMTQPDRFIGLHFFNPAHAMPLVEVIHRLSTPVGTIAAALSFAKRLRKTPVLVRNRTGFLVNRIFIPYLKEAFYLLEEGATPRAIDAAMTDFGMPMGPLALIDMAGLDVLVLTDAVMRKAFPQHGPLSEIVTTLVEQGHLGQKTGAGLYTYNKGDYTAHDRAETAAIIDAVQKKKGLSPRKIDKTEAADRLALRMVNEAFWAMDERIARQPSDVDVATVLGIGFPDFRGGVLKYAEDLGAETARTRLEALADRFGPRFRPPRD